MIAPLQRFVEALRAQGVSLSPAEVLDAARAADAVGPDDRARFRTALATTLAKDRRALAVFDETFDGFFAPPVRSGAGEGRGERGGAGGLGGAGGGSGAGERRPAPRSGDEPSAPAARRPSRPAPRDRASARALRALPASMLREELGKGRTPDGAPRAGREADRPSGARAEKDRGPHAARAAKPQSPPGPDRERKPRLSRLLGAEAPRPETASGDPRRRDLAAPMTPADERELAREIPRVLDEIRLRHTRRMRRAPRGRVFMKRAIRENLATGGVPFRIPTRRPRRRRARVVLVVDVSWSVATASGLFLLLAMEILRFDRRARVFFFVDHPVEATDAVRGWLRRGPAGPAASAGAQPPFPARRAAATGPSARGAASRGSASARGGSRRGGRGSATGVLSPVSGRSFGALLEEIPGLDPGAASDYGRAFWALSEGPLRVIARDAVLVVLGDARTNRFDPLPWAFEEIASRARRVLWLAPEPRVRWGTGDSAMPRYLPFCDVAVEARDLEGLAHGVREMVASL